MELSKARATGRGFVVAALFAGLTAAPALAENVPLPTPRPHVQPAAKKPLITGSVPAPAAAARAQAPAPQAQQQPPNPISNPFAALLGAPN